MRDYKSEFSELIQKVSLTIGKGIDISSYCIQDLGVPHKPKGLPIGKMGVYTFSFNDSFLKIGKAGPNSNARFRSQHYNPKSANSTLAASLIMDNEMGEYAIDDGNVKNWIVSNCRRIDVLMDVNLGLFALELVESVLHYYYEPKYEGFNSQHRM